MNKDIFAANWKKLKGKVKEQWGELTDDEVTKIDGKREQLVGFLQEKYGYAKEQAEMEVDSWEKENCPEACETGTCKPGFHRPKE